MKACFYFYFILFFTTTEKVTVTAKPVYWYSEKICLQNDQKVMTICVLIALNHQNKLYFCKLYKIHLIF